jgi:hypothetical protein
LNSKFLLAIFFIILFLTTGAYAQSMHRDTAYGPHTIIVKDSIPKAKIGAKIGASSNGLTGNLAFKQAYTTGITAGVYAEFRKKWYGLQMEAQVATATHQLQDSFINGGKMNFIYLDIPVLFECRLFPGLWLQAGPQIGTLVSVTQHPSTIVDPKTLFESNNFSAVIGLEAKLPRHLSVGARYVAGLTNINNGDVLNPAQAWRTTNVQFYIGFQFL